MGNGNGLNDTVPSQNCQRKSALASILFPLAPSVANRYRPNQAATATSTSTAHSVSDVTRIIEAIQHGDAKAAEDLLPLIYDDLRRLAAAKMAGQPPGQTLQATALVHEAWLRIAGENHP